MSADDRLSAEDAENIRLFEAMAEIPENSPPLPSPWDQRLLNRHWSDAPASGEQHRWKLWHARHELPIDVVVGDRLKRNARPRIQKDRVREEYAIGWCPYYMARWHVAFAATAANCEIAWPTTDAIRARLDPSSKPDSTSLRKSRYDAARRLRIMNDHYTTISDAFERAGLLDDWELIGATKYENDPTGLNSLAPNTKADVYSIDAKLSAYAAEMAALIAERRALTKEPDALLETSDENVWLQTFAGYMGVGWKRLTGRDPAESEPFEEWVQAGWRSLWEGEVPLKAVAWASRLRNARAKRETYRSHPRLVAGPFGRYPQSR